ncbi:hypothetical protein SBBP1_1080013 [Burkholderiales bacterium]|nr:hypothetical protein SBBP1_1080013 [Burkholderiales bacterium]
MFFGLWVIRYRAAQMRSGLQENSIRLPYPVYCYYLQYADSVRGTPLSIELLLPARRIAPGRVGRARARARLLGTGTDR